jgi:hypothetical protein
MIDDKEFCSLAECPVGLFLTKHGTLCLKTEYGDIDGLIDAYIVSSGEFFWGEQPQTISSQRKQLVYPISDEAVDNFVGSFLE